MTQMKTENEVTRRLKAEARRRLPLLLDFGNEDDIVAYAREINPKRTERELERIVRLFLDAKHERARARQPH